MTQKKVSKKKVATKKSRVARKPVPKGQTRHRVAKRGADREFEVGQSIPEFEIPATGGAPVSSSSLRGKNVVLYFYPKDSTPGCTIEGRDFSRLNKEFAKNKTVVFGISKDSLASHEKFKAKENFCFDLLSDVDGKLSEMFSVWKEKSLYGRKYMGIERSTFVIDSNGVLRHVWRGVKVAGHAEEVLEFVRGLGSAN